MGQRADGYTKFVNALVDQARAMKVGDPLAEDTGLGSLISLAHRDKVEGFIQSAIDDGATASDVWRAPQTSRAPCRWRLAGTDGERRYRSDLQGLHGGDIRACGRGSSLRHRGGGAGHRQQR